jgi:hypothetical protein
MPIWGRKFVTDSVSGHRDLLDQDGLEPPAIDARTACREIGAKPTP